MHGRIRRRGTHQVPMWERARLGSLVLAKDWMSANVGCWPNLGVGPRLILYGKGYGKRHSWDLGRVSEERANLHV